MGTSNSYLKVSVVIPVFNVEDYVEEAVDSILNQTLAPFEVIIVDDGSTDRSGAIVDSRYKKEHRVKIFHTKNQGLGEARNYGSKMAKGDFIYYFDSDDLAEKNLLSDFTDEYIKNPSLDLYGFSANRTHAYPLIRGFSGLFSSGKVAFNKLESRDVFFVAAWLHIFRRSLLSDKQLAFKPILHEDIEFIPKLYFVAGPTVIKDKVYYTQRMRVGSITHIKPTIKNIEGFLEGIKTLNALFLSETNKTTKKLLRKRIIYYSIESLKIQGQFNISIPQAELDNLKKLSVSYHSATLSIAILHSKLFFIVLKLAQLPRIIKGRYFFHLGNWK